MHAYRRVPMSLYVVRGVCLYTYVFVDVCVCKCACIRAVCLYVLVKECVRRHR